MVIPEISCQELAQRLKAPVGERPVLVDVRTEEEHDLVALPDALLMPLHQLGQLTQRIDALAGKQVVVYCHHGVRSLHGAAFLQQRGISASSLAGGIDRYAQEIDPSLPLY